MLVSIKLQPNLLTLGVSAYLSWILQFLSAKERMGMLEQLFLQPLHQLMNAKECTLLMAPHSERVSMLYAVTWDRCKALLSPTQLKQCLFRSVHYRIKHANKTYQLFVFSTL